jgi:hypothetical protein
MFDIDVLELLLFGLGYYPAAVLFFWFYDYDLTVLLIHNMHYDPIKPEVLPVTQCKALNMHFLKNMMLQINNSKFASKI